MNTIRIAGIAVVLAGVILALPCHAQNLDERRTGVYGIVLDENEQPVVGLGILLTQNMEKKVRPLKVKTNKKGMFTFPRLEFFEDGYRIGMDSEEYYIRDFQVKTRRMSREIWQDDAGRLTPTSQELLPVLKYRGGNATIRMTVGRVADYVAAPSPEALERAKAEQAAQAAQAQRELTLEQQADEALALGDVRAAADLLGQAVEQAPDDADLRWRRAETLAKAGDTAAALGEARTVLEAQPEREGARLKMADWITASGQASSALPLLEEQRELTPDDPELLSRLFDAYEDAGRPEDARQTIEHWVEVAPNDPQGLVGLAGIAAAEGDFERAEGLYARVAERDPENADRMYLNVGIAIMNKRGLKPADRERAITAFGKCLELNPKYARAHFELAMALLGVNRFGEARTHLAEFLRIAPEDPRAAQARGVMDALPN